MAVAELDETLVNSTIVTPKILGYKQVCGIEPGYPNRVHLKGYQLDVHISRTSTHNEMSTIIPTD